MGNLWSFLGYDVADNEQDESPFSPLGQQQLDYMTSRVKDVLPQVPLDVIRRDISVTANVDETITRLLDGTVRYSPVEVSSVKKKTPTVAPSSPPSSTSKEVSSPTTVSNDASSSYKQGERHQPRQSLLITAASSFAKTPSERHKSFEERKQLLIDACRQRYLEKHGSNAVKST